MLIANVVLPLLSIVLPTAAETVVGVYIFSRHGDRTSKSTPPTNLTDLGYQQVHQSGSYWRSRYVAGDASTKVQGLNSDRVKLSQLSVTAPVDNVLQNSATGFLQGLYPPIGSDVEVEALHNGSKISAPLNGYQLIPVNIVTGGTGSGSEDNTWLQDASGCANAKASSNRYFSSAEYREKLASTQEFYNNIYPAVNRTFTRDAVNFKNAYTVFDLMNCAYIQNQTLQAEGLYTDENRVQLRTLADAHEWGLAYNASDNMRAITGMQLAGEVVSYLNSTITSKGSKKLGIQFGAYATFLSFFGLSNAIAANPDLMGVPDYASSMAFELYTDVDNVEAGSFPSVDDLKVRFMFANGSATPQNQPKIYPLFGRSENSTSWNEFAKSMNEFAVHDAEQWCIKCGNSTGTCAAYAGSGTQSQNKGNGSGSGSGMSNAVAGAIGAMVTLAVIFGLEGLAMLLGGFRLVSRKRLAQGPSGVGAVTKA